MELYIVSSQREPHEFTMLYNNGYGVLNHQDI